MLRFLDAKVFHSSMSISDHCLIKLCPKRNQSRRPQKKRFMFKAMWTREDRCRDVVESAWDIGGNLSNVQLGDRLRNCKEKVKSWNWSEFGNVNHLLRQKGGQLQHLESLNNLHSNAGEVQRLKMEINEILNREEIMWNQRSWAMWMKWGDRNTKFFHAIANQRRKRNGIVGLLDSEGRWQVDPENIDGIILEYFGSIFKSNEPAEFEASLSAIHPKVTPVMNATLTANFRAEEVWITL